MWARISPASRPAPSAGATRSIINGNKRWCSGAEIADYIYALVRTGEPGERYKNLSLVLIPPTAKGVTLQHIPALGARGLNTNDVSFDNVEISIDDVVGGEAGWNQGWSKLAGPALEVEKLEVAAMALGHRRAGGGRCLGVFAAAPAIRPADLFDPVDPPHAGGCADQARVGAPHALPGLLAGG